MSTWLCALAACAAVSPAAADEPGDVALYAAFRAMDARVATTGHRLATRNAALCERRQPATGLTLSDIALYPAKQRAAVAAAYALDPAATTPVFVAAVAADSPAARAGLTVGSGVATIDGVALDRLGSPGGYARMAAIETAMAGWLADGRADIGLAQRAAPPVALIGQAACASIFQVRASAELGAAADGRYVQIDAALVDFAAAEEELAAVLAHELSHNILRHRERLDAAGIQRGLLQQFGRNAALTHATETEADRLSVWLLAGAGYDPAAATRFWTRWGEDHGDGLIASATHGRAAKRIATIAAEIAAMRAAVARDPAARPALLAAPPLG